MRSPGNKGFTRRGFLEICGLAGSGFLIRQSLGPAPAFAAPGDPKFFLLVYFSGGWDQLLALDPRNAKDSRFTLAGSKGASGSGIYPAYEESAAQDAELDATMNNTTIGGQTRTGVQQAGALSFGPAVSQSLVQHASSLAIVRGMSMDTLTHEVGRRYLLTGKFPRGLAASGSSLDTVVVGQTGSTLDLPNLAISGIESYNEGQPALASATKVQNANAVRTVLTPQAVGSPLGAAAESKLMAFQNLDDSCEARGLDGNGLVGQYRDAQRQARQMTNPAKASLFDFTLPAPNSQVNDVFTAFGIDSAAKINSPLGAAALAAQALTNGISQVVAVQLVGGLDDHFDMAGQQSVSQRSAWDALGRLISRLKAVNVPGLGKSYWDCTTMLCFSEFSRTPMLNARDGRDHHLAASCLVAGPGIQGNTVIGATSNDGMQAQKVNITTGQVATSGGVLIKPSDVHATLIKSMGLNTDHLSNQAPTIITKLLKP